MPVDGWAKQRSRELTASYDEIASEAFRRSYGGPRAGVIEQDSPEGASVSVIE